MLPAMQVLRMIAIGTALLVLSPATWPQSEAPRVWRVCVGDQPIPPYVLNDPRRLGRAERLIVEAGRSVELSVLIQRYPPKRCRAMVASGDSDMTLGAATPENLAEWRFPMKADAPDVERRIARLNLVWVRRPDSKLDWDGTQITGLPHGTTPRVGTRTGQRAATHALRNLPVQVDGTARSTNQLVRMLLASRFDLALGLQEEFEVALAEPDVKALTVLPRALVREDFYAVISHQHLQANLAPAERLWNAIGRMRDLPEFQRD